MKTRPVSCLWRHTVVVSAAACLILFTATAAFAAGGTIGPGDFESGNLLPPFNSVFTRSSDMTASNS
jgi:hypothetical protein